MINIEFVVAIAVSAISPFIIYVFKKYADSEEMKRELSSIIFSEVEYNKKVIIKNIQYDRKDIVVYLRTNVYEGIVSSTNIRYFTDELQEKLHDLYNDIKWQNDECKNKFSPVNVDLINMKHAHSKLRTRLKPKYGISICEKLHSVTKKIFKLKNEQVYINYQLKHYN